jgi:hypothetical protein
VTSPQVYVARAVVSDGEAKEDRVAAMPAR